MRSSGQPDAPAISGQSAHGGTGTLALENEPRAGSRALDKSGSSGKAQLCATGSGETNCDVQPKAIQRVVFKPRVLSFSFSNRLFPKALPRTEQVRCQEHSLWCKAGDTQRPAPDWPSHPGGCGARLTRDAQEAGRPGRQPAAPLQPPQTLPSLEGGCLPSCPLWKERCPAPAEKLSG